MSLAVHSYSMAGMVFFMIVWLCGIMFVSRFDS